MCTHCCVKLLLIEKQDGDIIACTIHGHAMDTHVHPRKSSRSLAIVGVAWLPNDKRGACSRRAHTRTRTLTRARVGVDSRKLEERLNFPRKWFIGKIFPRGCYFRLTGTKPTYRVIMRINIHVCVRVYVCACMCAQDARFIWPDWQSDSLSGSSVLEHRAKEVWYVLATFVSTRVMSPFAISPKHARGFTMTNFFLENRYTNYFYKNR